MDRPAFKHTALHFSIILFFAFQCICSNMMDHYSDHDNELQTVPEGGFSINRSLYVYSIHTTIHNSVENVNGMRFSNDGETWSYWTPYTSKYPWVLSYGNGARTVFGEFRDNNGNIHRARDSVIFIDRISADDREYDDYFGWSVSISADGNTAAAGVKRNLQGAVYIYEWVNQEWNETRLTHPEGASADRFGYSIALSSNGSTLLAGSPGIDNRGEAVIFEKDTVGNGSKWTSIGILKAEGGGLNQRFGYCVSISGNGNIAVIGVPGNNSERGAVYVYKRYNGGENNWRRIAQILPTDIGPSEQFGASASISFDGSILAVGAPYHRIGGFNFSQGAVYVYHRNSDEYQFQKKLVAHDGDEDDYLGKSLIVTPDGRKIAAGADGDDISSQGDDRGAVYIFNRDAGGANNWGETVRLVAEDSGNFDRFGRSIAASEDGGLILIGVHQNDNINRPDKGSVYLFRQNSDEYDKIEKITAPDGMENDCFGISVAVTHDGNRAAVGAHKDDTDSFSDDTGSVYIFNNIGE